MFSVLFCALEQHRMPISCVYDTADGMIISFMELGYSNRELKQLFKVGGYRLERIRMELKDPTLRAKKLAPKVPWHAFSDEDKNFVKNQIISWNPRLEDGFPCAHRRQARVFSDEEVSWISLYDDQNTCSRTNKNELPQMVAVCALLRSQHKACQV